MNQSQLLLSAAVMSLTAVVTVGGPAVLQNSHAAEAVSYVSETATQIAATDAHASDSSRISEMMIGNADAKVTIIEYASFTCPHCKTFHEDAFKTLRTDYIDTGKINFIFREVYFDKGGLWASMLARCGDGDRFFAIADVLFERQQEWTSRDDIELARGLQKIGRLVGYDSETLDSCWQDRDKLRALVAWYQENAAEHSIRSTPSFVINGKTYPNMDYDEMTGILDGLINGT